MCCALSNTMQLKAIILLFLIGCGNCSSNKDKKEEKTNVFVPSKEWKEIKEGEKVPSGLHYRINLSTGKKEAKIIDDTDDKDLESTKSFVLAEESDENEETLNANEIETFLKEVNKKNPENDMPKKFRTLEEIKKDLSDIELQPKSDVEILKALFKKFEDEEKKKQKDDSVILDILRDLKYLGHQIDNGNEFYKLDGFKNIIYKELNSTNTVIKRETLKLFSVLAQNNPMVKIHILETGGITTLLRILNLENNFFIKKSALFALSCTLRTFPHAQNKFVEMGGITIFTDLFKTESIKLKLQIVTLLHDLIVERQKDNTNFRSHDFIDIEQSLYNLNWCNYLNELLHDLVVIDINDFDSIEKCLLAMKSISVKCRDSFKNDLILKLHEQYSLLAKENDDDSGDYFKYLSDLTGTLIDKVTPNLDKEEL